MDKPPGILITGVTGFLGGATATHLIQSGHGQRLLFLVRADDPAAGLQRVQRSLARFGLGDDDLDRLTERQVIAGDLAAVQDFENDPRLDDVTRVLNCAAIASFSNHPGIWPVNVEGTFRFATRMAAVKGLERFLHVGTAMACGPNATSPVAESWETPQSEEHLVPYTASKAEIERRLRHDLPNLPLVVARPSIVVGHTRYGCAPSSSIFWVFRMAHSLEQFTCSLDERVDVVPVDYCADVLARLLTAETLRWNLYHISAGSQASDTFGDIDRAYSRALGREPLGRRYRQIGLGDIPGLLSQFRERLGDCNRRLVARAVRLYGGFAELNFTFDNSRVLAEGCVVSPSFTSYIHRCVETSNGIPLREMMLEDFK